MGAPSSDIWALLEAGDKPEPVATPKPAEAKESPPRPRFTMFWVLLDAFALSAWVYVFLKLFVADVDQALFRRFAPSYLWLLDYRIALIPVGAVVVATLFWKWRALGCVFYIAFFPAVVLFWKLPKLFISLKLYQSWFAWLVLLNSLAAFGQSIRYQLLTKGLAILALATIALSGTAWAIQLAGIALLTLFVVAVVRTVSQSFRSSAFLKSQQALLSLVSKLTDGDFKLVPTVEGRCLTATQTQTLVSQIQNAAIVNRALYLWAYKLRQYRQLNLTIVFNALSYAALFLGSIIVFWFANLALLKVAPTEFSFSTTPSSIAVALYGLSSLILAEGGGLIARGDAAFTLRIVAALFGPTFLLTLSTSLCLAFRESRGDAQLQETVGDLRNRARRHEAAFRKATRVGFDEACDRLAALGFVGFLNGLSWIRSRVPQEFFDVDAATDETQ